jgi:hypothetical protein
VPKKAWLARNIAASVSVGFEAALWPLLVVGRLILKASFLPDRLAKSCVPV